MTTTDRAGYIAGIRTLADALEANEELPLPYHGADQTLSVFVQTKAEAVAYARLMGKAEKSYDDGAHYGFRLTGKLDGLSLLVYAPRQEVCTRVVTGTETVTREIPDAEALAAAARDAQRRDPAALGLGRRREDLEVDVGHDVGGNHLGVERVDPELRRGLRQVECPPLRLQTAWPDSRSTR